MIQFFVSIIRPVLRQQKLCLPAVRAASVSNAERFFQQFQYHRKRQEYRGFYRYRRHLNNPLIFSVRFLEEKRRRFLSRDNHRVFLFLSTLFSELPLLPLIEGGTF